MRKHPRVMRVSAFTLSVALTLPCVGAWAEDPALDARDANQGAAVQAPAPDAAPAPPADQPAPPAAEAAPAAPENQPPPAPGAEPDRAPVSPDANPAEPDAQAPANPDAADVVAPGDPAPPLQDRRIAPQDQAPQPNQPPQPDQAPQPDQPPQPDQAPQPDQEPQPDPAPPAVDPAPLVPQEPAPAAPDQAPRDQAPAQEPAPAPDQAPQQPVPAPDQAPPQEPAPIAPDSTPAPPPQPAPIAPDAPPVPAPDQAPPAEPDARTLQEERTTVQPPATAEAVHSPLQEFLSHQVHEVGMLSRQIDQFKAADRPDVVRVLQHMIRDHVLVADASRNVLARRRDVSRPVMLTPEPMPASTEEIIRQNIQHHEQMLAQTEQLLANASSPAERSVYQQAVRGTRQHLNWLRQLDQGQQVALGFFGPTTPLSRIAGFRQAAQQSVSPRERTASGRTVRRTGRRAARARR